MGLDRGIQIDVGDDLSVDDDKRIVLEECARVVERAARAEYHRLFNVIKLHPETAAITERSSHRLRTMMQVHDDLIDAIAGEILGDVTDKRFSQNRYRGFGAVFSEWPKACTVAGRKNNRAHQGSGSLGGGVTHDEVEGPGGDFAKARVAIEGDGDADGRVLTGELEATFEEAVVKLVDVQWSTFFAKQERYGLRDRAVHEAIAQNFDVVADCRDLWATLDRNLCAQRRLRRRLAHGRLELSVRWQSKIDVARCQHGRKKTVDRGLRLARERIHLSELRANAISLGLELAQTCRQMHPRRARLSQALFQT